MLVYNYSKCHIKYHCSDDLSKKYLHLKSEFNLKFLLDPESSKLEFASLTNYILLLNNN